jgi:acyl phosphate:glycerol-3-phosphate acyltransferase
VIYFFVVLSYFLGTLPSAIIIARSKGIDIMTVGSGNPGASNVARALGTKYGALVFFLDAAKGAIPAVLGLAANGDAGAYICATAAILGHMFPITRKFRGGKGIATGAGMMLVMHWYILAYLLTSWLIIAKITKKASIGSVLLVPTVPIVLWIIGTPVWEILTIIGIGLLIEVKHFPNIKRLISGNEPPVTDVSS